MVLHTIYVKNDGEMKRTIPQAPSSSNRTLPLADVEKRLEHLWEPNRALASSETQSVD